MSNDTALSDLLAEQKRTEIEAAKLDQAATEAKSAAEQAKNTADDASRRSAEKPDDAELKLAAEGATNDFNTKSEALEQAEKVANTARAAANAAATAFAAAIVTADSASATTPTATSGTDGGAAAEVKPAVTTVAQRETPNPMFMASPMSTSYFDLLKAITTDPSLNGEQKKFLLLNLKGISPTSDRLTYRTAIWLLGAIALMTIGAIWHLMLSEWDISVPDGLIAIASGAVGGLAGLLSPSRGSDGRVP